MTTPKWLPFRPQAFESLGVEWGSLLIVARPDGKSWSGTLCDNKATHITLANANSKTDLHFAMNPTASYMILPKPKWELGFGDNKLPF